jgi:hypothetical protein
VVKGVQKTSVPSHYIMIGSRLWCEPCPQPGGHIHASSRCICRHETYCEWVCIMCESVRIMLAIFGNLPRRSLRGTLPPTISVNGITTLAACPPGQLESEGPQTKRRGVPACATWNSHWSSYSMKLAW